MSIPSGSADGGYRAFIEFAGRSIALRQLDLALSLGCERVICLADHLHQPMLPLQHRCEAAGVRFHVVTGPRALSGLIKGMDDLIVLAEGLLPLERNVLNMLARQNGVLVLPAETGIPAGFERVDLNYAWAGALSMPGKLVERLTELPVDCDAVGSLLRIALQARVPEIPLAETEFTEGRWILFTGQEQATDLTPSWLRRQLPGNAGLSPFSCLAETMLSTFAVPLLRKGRGVGAYALLTPLLTLLALALGLGFSPALGFILAGLSYFAGEFTEKWRNLLVTALGADRPRPLMQQIQMWLLDGCFAAIIASGLVMERFGLRDGIFYGISFIALLQLLITLVPTGPRGLVEDRGVLGVILSLAALAGSILSVLQVIMVIGLVSGVAIQHFRQR
jgi:hypothetical protein